MALVPCGPRPAPKSEYTFHHSPLRPALFDAATDSASDPFLGSEVTVTVDHRGWKDSQFNESGIATIRKRGLHKIERFLPTLSDGTPSVVKRTTTMLDTTNFKFKSIRKGRIDRTRPHKATKRKPDKYCPMCSCRLTYLYSNTRTNQLTEIHGGFDSPSTRARHALPPYCIGCRAYLVFVRWNTERRSVLMHNLEKRLDGALDEEEYGDTGRMSGPCGSDEYNTARILVVGSPSSVSDEDGDGYSKINASSSGSSDGGHALSNLDERGSCSDEESVMITTEVPFDLGAVSSLTNLFPDATGEEGRGNNCRDVDRNFEKVNRQTLGDLGKGGSCSDKNVMITTDDLGVVSSLTNHFQDARTDGGSCGNSEDIDGKSQEIQPEDVVSFTKLSQNPICRPNNPEDIVRRQPKPYRRKGQITYDSYDRMESTENEQRQDCDTSNVVIQRQDEQRADHTIIGLDVLDDRSHDDPFSGFNNDQEPVEESTNPVPNAGPKKDDHILPDPVPNTIDECPSSVMRDPLVNPKSPPPVLDELAANARLAEAHLALASTFSEEFAMFQSYYIKKEAATKQIAKRLRKGYELTTMKCDLCDMPMMRNDGEVICVSCPAIMRKVRQLVKVRRNGLKTPRMSNKQFMGSLLDRDETSDVDADVVFDPDERDPDYCSVVNTSANQFESNVVHPERVISANPNLSMLEEGLFVSHSAHVDAMSNDQRDYWVQHSSSQVSVEQLPSHHNVMVQPFEGIQQRIGGTFESQNLLHRQASRYVHPNRMDHRDNVVTGQMSHLRDAATRSVQLDQGVFHNHSIDAQDSFHQQPIHDGQPNRIDHRNNDVTGQTSRSVRLDQGFVQNHSIDAHDSFHPQAPQYGQPNRMNHRNNDVTGQTSHLQDVAAGSVQLDQNFFQNHSIDAQDSFHPQAPHYGQPNRTDHRNNDVTGQTLRSVRLDQGFVQNHSIDAHDSFHPQAPHYGQPNRIDHRNNVITGQTSATSLEQLDQDSFQNHSIDAQDSFHQQAPHHRQPNRIHRNNDVTGQTSHPQDVAVGSVQLDQGVFQNYNIDAQDSFHHYAPHYGQPNRIDNRNNDVSGQTSVTSLEQLDRGSFQNHSIDAQDFFHQQAPHHRQPNRRDFRDSIVIGQTCYYHDVQSEHASFHDCGTNAHDRFHQQTSQYSQPHRRDSRGTFVIEQTSYPQDVANISVHLDRGIFQNHIIDAQDPFHQRAPHYSQTNTEDFRDSGKTTYYQDVATKFVQSEQGSFQNHSMNEESLESVTRCPRNLPSKEMIWNNSFYDDSGLAYPVQSCVSSQIPRRLEVSDERDDDKKNIPISHDRGSDFDSSRWDRSKLRVPLPEFKHVENNQGSSSETLPHLADRKRNSSRSHDLTGEYNEVLSISAVLNSNETKRMNGKSPQETPPRYNSRIGTVHHQIRISEERGGHVKQQFRDLETRQPGAIEENTQRRETHSHQIHIGGHVLKPQYRVLQPRKPGVIEEDAQMRETNSHQIRTSEDVKQESRHLEPRHPGVMEENSHIEESRNRQIRIGHVNQRSRHSEPRKQGVIEENARMRESHVRHIRVERHADQQSRHTQMRETNDHQIGIEGLDDRQSRHFEPHQRGVIDENTRMRESLHKIRVEGHVDQQSRHFESHHPGVIQENTEMRETHDHQIRIGGHDDKESRHFEPHHPGVIQENTHGTAPSALLDALPILTLEEEQLRERIDHLTNSMKKAANQFQSSTVVSHPELDNDLQHRCRTSPYDDNIMNGPDTAAFAEQSNRRYDTCPPSAERSCPSPSHIRDHESPSSYLNHVNHFIDTEAYRSTLPRREHSQLIGHVLSTGNEYTPHKSPCNETKSSNVLSRHTSSGTKRHNMKLKLHGKEPITPKRFGSDPPGQTMNRPRFNGKDPPEYDSHSAAHPQKRSQSIDHLSTTSPQEKIGHAGSPSSIMERSSTPERPILQPSNYSIHLKIPSWVDDEIDLPIKLTKSWGETSMDILLKKIDEIENDFGSIVASLPGTEGNNTRSDDDSTLASKMCFEGFGPSMHLPLASMSFESHASQDKVVSDLRQQMRAVQDQIEHLDSAELDDGSDGGYESQGEMNQLIQRLAIAAESLRSLQIE